MLYSATILVLFCICSSVSEDLPSYFPRCYLDDPQLNECVLRAFNEIRPHVSNGIEEIGLPSLNPFLIPKVLIQQDTPLANYTVTIYNFTIGGLDNYDIKEFQYDKETMSFRFKIEFGSVTMGLFVDVNGHLIKIPVKGKGISKHAYSSISAIFEIKGDMEKSKGIDYYSPKKVNVTLDMRDGNYYVEGLFDNNELLVRMTNEMLNANSALVDESLTPMFEKLAEEGVMRFIKTLTKIPYYKLFPTSD